MNPATIANGMSANPYLITGPALISFSGGRTSAYMLYQILQAHGGTLPEDVHVCFANTGKEREETLRFVHECATRWGVRVRWLEWRDRRKRTPVAERFQEVGYNSAARNGEPFKALIRSKRAVPNAVQRWCTTHLKFQVCADFMQVHGYPEWKNVIGLRADEMHRVLKKLSENHEQDNPWTNVMPMASSGPNKAFRRTKADVMRFWRAPIGCPPPQGFDLELEPWEGNCTKCMMKSKALLKWDIRRDPADAEDWAGMEDMGGGTFTTEYSIRDLINEVRSSPLLPLEPGDVEFDAECSTWCIGEAA